MFSTSDTIVAIATPPGRGGIGVVRLSGPDAHAVARGLIAHEGPLEPRRATFTTIITIRADAGSGRHEGPQAEGPRQAPPPHAQAGALDHVIATYFPAPASYTGDDVVELSAHGSPVILRAIVAAAIDHGARLAEPGEFTLRAFLNGRIDLMQAEAVADLIDAVTPLQARAAFDQLQGTLTRAIGDIDAALFHLIARLEASVDFPEEGYHFVDAGELATAIDTLTDGIDALLVDARRGRLVREGLQIAIAGQPNVGKSSVFIALVGASRAIVADAPGTTRDLVTEVVEIDGLRVTLVDTAGLRDTEDHVETEGVERARRAQLVSDLILLVVDRSQTIDPEIVIQDVGVKRLIVVNKIDLPPAWRLADPSVSQLFRLCVTPALAEASADGRSFTGAGSADGRSRAEAVVPAQAVEVSALTGEGFDRLRACIVEALDVEPLTDRPAITNVRHITLVARAREALARARAAALGEDGSLSEEFVLADLQEARGALEEIAGRRAPDDLLAHIFSRFCIGK